MRIGIFGHSDARRIPPDFVDFPVRNTIIDEWFNGVHQIDWYGVGFCSSERLLRLLQKHKNYDLYFIFLLSSEYIFCPNAKRDFKDSTIKKWAKGIQKDNGLFLLDRADAQSYSKMWSVSKDELKNRWLGSLILINNLLKDRDAILIPPRDAMVATKVLTNCEVSSTLHKVVGSRMAWGEEYKETQADYEQILAKAFIEEIENFVTSH